MVAPHSARIAPFACRGRLFRPSRRPLTCWDFTQRLGFHGFFTMAGIQRAGERQKQCTYTPYLSGSRHQTPVWVVTLAEWLTRQFCYRFQLLTFEASSNPRLHFNHDIFYSEYHHALWTTHSLLDGSYETYGHMRHASRAQDSITTERARS